MYMFFFIINSSLSPTQMEQIISPFPIPFSVQSLSLLVIISFGKTSPPGVCPWLSFYLDCVIKKLVGKEVERRKRSREYDLGLDGSALRQKRTYEKRAGKHPPLPQKFRFAPRETGSQVCDHILRLTSQSISVFSVRVSLRAKSSEMCF